MTWNIGAGYAPESLVDNKAVGLCGQHLMTVARVGVI